MTIFNTNFKSVDTSRRGPSQHNRQNFGNKKVIDVFGRQTSNGEFPVYVNAAGEISNTARAGAITTLLFGMDEFGWPYVTVTGNQNGWQFNGQAVQVGGHKLIYLNISPSASSDELTNASLDCKFYFQTKGLRGTEFFCVCWQLLKAGDISVNPIFLR